MAAAVETRAPLVPLYPQNSQDLGRQSSAWTKHQKFARKSASMGASRGVLTENAEQMKISPITERFVLRGYTKQTSSPPEPIAADALPVAQISQPQTNVMEELPQSGTKSLAASHNESDQAMNQQDDRDDQAVVDDDQDSKSLLQLKMEAMTWAAMAKDYTISSLERRLRTALEIAKGEQERNQELERLFRESREREQATAQELQDAKQQIGQLIEAEERLCVQLGDLEVEAVEEDRIYRSQIATLAERIEAQDRFIANSLKPLMPAQPAVHQSNPRSEAQGSEHDSLAVKLDMAQKKIATLRADLCDAKTDLRVSEGLKRNQSRRLKALEKERRYLMRKGAIRSVRLAPRPQKRNETEAPGGQGWKVFSILDFEA